MNIKSAIKILNQPEEWCEGEIELKYGYFEASNMAAEALDRFRWISVSERLPQVSDYCPYNETDYCISVLRNGHEPDMIWTRSPDGCDKDYFEDCEYTHWMPLPKLPQEVE